MKTLALATLLASPILTIQANASTVLDCNLTKSGQSVQIVLENDKDTEVILGSQTLHGTFSLTDAATGTRLSGYKILKVEANYALPDYSKPHTVQASLVLRPPDFNSGFGWISITGLIGTIQMANSSADCKAKRISISTDPLQ